MPDNQNFRLDPGSKIALVAPAASFDETSFREVIKLIEKWGYNPVYSHCVFEKHGEFAGKDWIRAEDFEKWFREPDVSMVWAIRGGYGSSRILSFLNLDTISSSKKIFLGYSDMTFLHLALVNKGFQGSFHGPNAVELSDLKIEKTEVIYQFLQGAFEFRWKYKEAQILRHGVASGRLIGGNLTCLCHLLGTPFLNPDIWNGALLFLEDCNEAGYRIDRMFNHLKLAGVFDNIKGLVLGSFRNCEPSPNFRSRILDILASFDFPIICDMPFGHNIRQDVLPLGQSFYMNTFEHFLEMN